jgi:hypothetical protein
MVQCQLSKMAVEEFSAAGRGIVAFPGPVGLANLLSS